MKRHRAFRRSLISTVSRAVESLEPRRFFDAAYFNLSTGSLSQNWENPALLTTNNIWSGVPSFEGFSGTTLTGTSDPTTRTGADASGVLQVSVNQTNPSTFTTGGPAEFALTAAIPSTTPNTGLNTVAIQGSSGNAPYLKAYLNSTGAGSIHVKYDLIDIDGGVPSTATPPVVSTQPFTLQYRVGTTGNFTNVAGSFIANAADQAAGAVGKTTSFDVTLPVDAENVPQLQIRFVTADAAGSDQEVAIENIVVSSTPIANTPGTISLSSNLFTATEAAGTYNGITVTAYGSSLGAVSATYTISAGTAATPADFGGTLTGTVNFADGQITAVIIPVNIVQDAIAEGTENFTVTLSNAQGGATLGTASATVNITDDDFAGSFAFGSAPPP